MSEVYVDSIQAKVNGTAQAVPLRDSDAQEKIDSLSEEIAFFTIPKGVPTGEDDSDLINEFIETCTNSGFRKLSFPKSDYRLWHPINIISGDIEIDFNGSTLHWHGTDDLGSVYGEYGVINICGEMVGGNVKEYIRTSQTLTQGVQNPPDESPVLTYLSSVNVDMNTKSSKICGRFKTDNNDYFSIGDYVWLNGWTQKALPYTQTLYRPEIKVIAQIIAKDLNYLYIDYMPKFEFSTSFINNDTVKSRALKVKLVNNVTLKNVNIIDESSVDLQKTCWVSGVSVYLAKNPKLENINVSRHKFPAIYSCMNYGHYYNNIHANDAKKYGGGEGYTIQHIACTKGITKNVSGNRVRHVADYSWSTYCKLENAYGIDNLDADLNFHGCCEHDITFINCRGKCNMGSGLKYFPCMAQNVKFIHCDLRWIYVWAMFVQGILFDDCEINCDSVPLYVNTTYINSRIKSSFGALPTINAFKKNNTGSNKFEIHNTEISFSGSSDTSILTFGKVDEFIVLNSKLEVSSNVFNLLDSVPKIKLSSKITRIIGNELENIGFMIGNIENGASKITFSENNVTIGLIKNISELFKISEFDNINCFLCISENKITQTGDNENNYVLSLISKGDIFTNTVILAIITDNIMYGNNIISGGGLEKSNGISVFANVKGNITKNTVGNFLTQEGNIVVN